MPKRRRTTVGMPAPRKVKRKVAKRRDDIPEPEYDIPSKHEFQRMHSYGSFAVKDEDEMSHYFKVGCDALIVPEGIDPDERLDLHEHWVGKVLEVRARDKDPSEVWVRVQWYWSANHVNVMHKGKKQKLPLGKMELLYSTAQDFVHSTCFQGLAEVVNFSEDDTTQRPIDTETFYWRYEYDPAKQRILPPETLKGTCLCKKPYNPDGDDIMRFCPTCRKSYHESCLIDDDWFDKKPTRSDKLPREVRLERSLESISSEYASLPALERHPSPSASLGKLEVIYSNLPLELLQLARSPIVRGGHGHGVVGNIFPVMQARTLIQNALMDGERIPDSWTEEMSSNLPKFQAWIVEDDDKLLCPNCKGVI